MTDRIKPRVKYVIGPDGSPLTIADLPPASTRRWVIRRKAEVVAAVWWSVEPGRSLQPLYFASTRRWVIRRKAEVVAAVRGGLLSLEEACNRYTLTVEEFLSWQLSIDSHGLAGLRTTRIQQYR